MVRTDELFTPTVDGVNALATLIDPSTESDALAAVVLEPEFVLVTAPIGSVLA